MKTKNQLSILLGTNISTLRKGLGISQKDMAKMLEISQDAMMKMEKGDIAPKMSRLEDIASILQCSVMTLFKDKEMNKEDCAIYLLNNINTLDFEEQKYLIEVLESTMSFIKSRRI